MNAASLHFLFNALAPRLRELADAEVGEEPHVCEHSYDEATSATHSGVITVTERCDCGAALHTYHDSIL